MASKFVPQPTEPNDPRNGNWRCNQIQLIDLPKTAFVTTSGPGKRHPSARQVEATDAAPVTSPSAMSTGGTHRSTVPATTPTWWKGSRSAFDSSTLARVLVMRHKRQTAGIRNRRQGSPHGTGPRRKSRATPWWSPARRCRTRCTSVTNPTIAARGRTSSTRIGGLPSRSTRAGCRSDFNSRII